MNFAPATWAAAGPGRRIQVQLQRFGHHPGASWSLSWIALFAGGVVLDPADGGIAAVVAPILSALFAGLTWVGGLAFAGHRAPLWILPAALASGVARSVVHAAAGPAAGEAIGLLYEPGAIVAATVAIWGADLLDDERGLRSLLVASLGAVACLEIVDGLSPGVLAIPDPRVAWFAIAPFAAFFELGAMWAWIARRELRIEQAEDGQRALESAVARERRVNDLLRRKEAWLFDFFEKAPDMLLVLDPGTSEILRCNRRFSEMLGYARRDLIGRTLLDFVDPGNVGGIRKILEARRRSVRNLMLHLRRHDGSELIALANLAAHSDPDGGVEVRAVLHDVTRLDAVSHAELHRAVAEHAGAGLFHADHRGRCSLVNASFCELTGLTAQAARGHSWLRCVHPGDRSAVEQAWDRSVGKGTVFRAEHRVHPVAGASPRVVTECLPIPESEGGGFAGSMMRVSRPSTAASRGAARRDRESARGDAPGR